MSGGLAWRHQGDFDLKWVEPGSFAVDLYPCSDGGRPDQWLKYVTGEGTLDALQQRLKNVCVGCCADIVLDLGELGEMYEYDFCRWYGSLSSKSTDSDNARRYDYETSGEYLQASFLHHPKRRVSCPPPQSRAVLLRDTLDPSYRWCVCAGLKIDACACL